MNFNRKLVFDVACVTLIAALVYLFPGETLFILSLAAVFLVLVILARTGIKPSLKWILVFEASFVTVLSLLAFLFPEERDQVLGLAGILLVSVLLHALVVPFKGLDFVTMDAPPDSMATYYWWVVLMVAILLGGWGEAVILRLIE